MNIFYKGSMAWKRVLTVAVLSAIVTATLNLIPALANTSFTAPATTMEVWVVLALYILLNCNSWKEAALKTFVFFLVSQPLIYLIEAPFTADGFGLFRYYPYWAAWTVAAAPIAAMAYFIKKDSIPSALILALANFAIIFSGTYWFRSTIESFPSHILASAFCLIVPFVLVFALLKQKKSRIVALVATATIVVSLAVTQLFFATPGSLGFEIEEGSWHLAEPAPAGMTVNVDENCVNLSSTVNGTFTLTFVSDDGRTASRDVVIEGISHTPSLLNPDGSKM